MKILTDVEINQVNGGFFWKVLPIVIGGGYLYGSDRAKRDNARDRNQQCQA